MTAERCILIIVLLWGGGIFLGASFVTNEEWQTIVGAFAGFLGGVVLAESSK